MLACCREFYEKLGRKIKVRLIEIKYLFEKPGFLLNFKDANLIFSFFILVSFLCINKNERNN